MLESKHFETGIPRELVKKSVDRAIIIIILIIFSLGPEIDEPFEPLEPFDFDIIIPLLFDIILPLLFDLEEDEK